MKEAIGAGAIKVAGKRSDAERFLSTLTFDEHRHSGQLEHV